MSTAAQARTYTELAGQRQPTIGAADLRAELATASFYRCNCGNSLRTGKEFKPAFKAILVGNRPGQDGVEKPLGQQNDCRLFGRGGTCGARPQFGDLPACAAQSILDDARSAWVPGPMGGGRPAAPSAYLRQPPLTQGGPEARGKGAIRAFPGKADTGFPRGNATNIDAS